MKKRKEKQGFKFDKHRHPMMSKADEDILQLMKECSLEDIAELLIQMSSHARDLQTHLNVLKEASTMMARVLDDKTEDMSNMSAALAEQSQRLKACVCNNAVETAH